MVIVLQTEASMNSQLALEPLPMFRLLLISLAATLFLSSAVAQELEPAFESYPSDMAKEPFSGFQIESPEDGFSLRFGGKMDFDWTSFAAGGDVVDRSGTFHDGAELRRARLAFSGEAYDWLEFKASFDFTATKSGLRDMWLAVDDIPVLGKLRIGHFKEPFGLERSTSSSSQLFLERSSAAALTPSRNAGFAFSDTLWDKQATWAAGVFRETDSSGEAQDSVFGSEIGYTGRFTFLPWYEKSGQRLLHLGLSLSSRQPDDGEMRIAEGMQLHQSPTLVDTGLFAVDSITIVGLEAAAVMGPFSLQGEWLQTKAQLGGGGEVTFPGFYLQAGYFLTGESRAYSRTKGRFSWPEVGSAFHPKADGMGAWELATRLSKLDLDNGPIAGGVLRSASAGLNWYLNEDVKVQFDYEYAELESFGNVHGVAVRVEFLW